MKTLIDKDLIYFLKKETRKKQKIQEIVESILFNIVWFRNLKNIPVNKYLENVRKEYQWKLYKKKVQYKNFDYIFNKTKLAINIIIFNKNTLFEYKILNKLSDKILTNSNQRYVGSKADYYNVEQLLFEDISKIYW